VLMSGMMRSSGSGVGSVWSHGFGVLRPDPSAVLEYNCMPNDKQLQAPSERLRSPGTPGPERSGRPGMPPWDPSGPIASDP